MSASSLRGGKGYASRNIDKDLPLPHSKMKSFRQMGGSEMFPVGKNHEIHESPWYYLGKWESIISVLMKNAFEKIL